MGGQQGAPWKQPVIRLYSQFGGPGSTEAQIALLSRRIAIVTQHLQENPNDKASRRGLTGAVNQRKRLLKYLQRVSPRSYHLLTRALAIRVPGLRPPTDAERRAAQETFDWHIRVETGSPGPVIDEALRAQLKSDPERLIDVLLRLAETEQIDPDQADGIRSTVATFRGCEVISSAGRYRELRGPVRCFRSLVDDARIQFMRLREGDEAVVSTEEEDEHDGVGSVVSTDPEAEDLSPLHAVFNKHRTRMATGSCRVLIIDDGFDLNQRFYNNHLGKRVTAACIAGKTGRPVTLADPYREGKIGRGDHGDRVANLILDIAPHAELFLAQRESGQALDVNLYDIMNLVNRWAKSDPLIVNLSFGTNLGAHDGQGELEMAMENHIFHYASHPRFSVKSAGNEGDGGIHTKISKHLYPSGFSLDLDVTFNQTNSGPSEETISIWHDTRWTIDYAVETPDGLKTPTYCDTSDTKGWVPIQHKLGANTVRMGWTSGPGGECELRVRLSGNPIQGGRWRVWFYPRLSSSVPPAKPMEVRAWLARTPLRRARFSEPMTTGTITIPGTSQRAITVTGYSNKGPLSYASRGPTYNPRYEKKPDMALPAFSTLGGVTKHGTSFAAPRLVGCLALLLSSGIATSDKDVHEILRKSCGGVGGGAWDDSLGYGRFDYQLFAAQLP